MSRRADLGILICVLTGGFALAEFSSPPGSLSTGVSPRGLAVGSPFQDGKPCLVVANFGAPTFIGQGTEPAQRVPSNSSLQIFRSSPTGLRLEATIPTALSPRGVELFDLDGDGIQEVLVTAYEGGVLQVFSQKQGSFQMTQEVGGFDRPVGLSVGKPHPNGPCFVVVAEHGTDRAVILRVKEGILQGRKDISVSRGPVQAAFGDLDGDGIQEAAVVCLAAGSVDLLKFEGEEARVSDRLTLPEGSSPSDLGISDLDQDGRKDLVVSEFAKNGIWIFLQKDGRLLGQPFLGSSGNHPNGLTIADLEGDGQAEILLPNRDSDSIDLFRREGGVFRLQESLRTAPEEGLTFGPVELGVLDLDGDGDRDLVATHMRSGSLKVFLGQGDRKIAMVHPPEQNKDTPFSPGSTRAEPNPSMTGDVSFIFSLNGPASVSLRVFDIAGTLIWTKTVGASETHPGENRIIWKGRNQDEVKVASGLYLYRITAEGRTVTKKVAIIR